jgi:hypothetical protein
MMSVAASNESLDELERICNEVTVTNKGIIPAFAWKD